MQGVAYSGIMALRSTTAIVRNIPNVFVEALRLDGSQAVVLEKAKQQFNNYIETLEQCGVKVVSLPSDERFPDCPFVEDVAVVIGARALVTRPGHPSRRGEMTVMREALKSLQKAPQIYEMEDPEAFVDGGDVLFTGREIFVGQSSRTNQKGVQCLAKTFPEFSVTPFPIRSSLHLKSLATMCGDDMIAVGGDQEAAETLKSMKSQAKFKYNYVQLDSNSAANVLLVNDNVFVKPGEEIGHHNYDILKKHVKGRIIDVPFSEFYKVDGCLTCCSVLINQEAVSG
ncbi:N(G),N(G)-dimethylarginine dimethylaminohydrolase 1-like [Haliotis rubra]|uniref:N(G),N(G)-dimethylarginine dimethylaminohydrolase 1-like n=1 Tax=Haliotis rubra TaxID=36100 RepID=UPI001EE532BD|nr:N(G),N(G)-dimethylarginine dimethylaminohydrolase 1-like [Haliotis rubra]